MTDLLTTALMISSYEAAERRARVSNEDVILVPASECGRLLVKHARLGAARDEAVAQLAHWKAVVDQLEAAIAADADDALVDTERPPVAATG